MSEPDSKRKTFVVPETAAPRRGGIAFSFGDDDGRRDVTRPIAYDEQGRPLYAPRGLIVRWGTP